MKKIFKRDKAMYCWHDEIMRFLTVSMTLNIRNKLFIRI